MRLWSVHTVAILITLDPTTKELPVLDVQPGTHAKINSVSNIIQVLSISLCIYLSIYLSLFLFIFPTTYIHLSIICKFIHDCTIYLFFVQKFSQKLSWYCQRTSFMDQFIIIWLNHGFMNDISFSVCFYQMKNL